MKELVLYEFYASTDKLNWTLFSSSKIMYDELEEELITEIHYDKLSEKKDGLNLSFYKKSLFNIKEHWNFHNWFYSVDINIYPGETLYIKKVPISKKDASFDVLSRNLSCQELIEYMKDNGMNVCPMKI